MKHHSKLLYLILFLLIACSPSPNAISTAIKETQQAIETNTSNPTITPTYTITPNPSITPSQASTPIVDKNLRKGNISYDLPSGMGWCLTDKTDDPYGITDHLASFCTFTNDPTTFIEIIHLNSKHTSNKEAIEFYIGLFKDSGFEILNINYMEYEDVIPIGKAQLALIDMTHAQLNNPMYLVVGAFSANKEYYIVEGKGGDSDSDFVYLIQSIYDVLMSVALQE